MSRYRFELASEADDEELRRVLAETPMDGTISVSFRREPSYFDAALVSGGDCQTVVGHEERTGRIIGFGVRSVREMFVNGAPTPIGYLSSLRLLPTYRSLGLVARGYAYFRELHGDGRTRLYLTTIAEGNERAITILTSARAGLPPYHFAGRYVTVAIPARRRRGNGRAGDVETRPATAADLPALLDFWQSAGSARQFFPCYERKDLFHPRATFREMQPGDLLLALKKGRIVGTLGVWDQSGFRQTVVERYSSGLRLLKPLYNCWAAVRRQPPLPRVGEPFRYCAAAVPVVAGDAATVFEALLARARDRAAERSAGHLLVGLHVSDPLLPVAAAQQATAYVTRLYYVCWDDGDELRNRLDGRPPYLELGTL